MLAMGLLLAVYKLLHFDKRMRVEIFRPCARGTLAPKAISVSFSCEIFPRLLPYRNEEGFGLFPNESCGCKVGRSRAVAQKRQLLESARQPPEKFQLDRSPLGDAADLLREAVGMTTQKPWLQAVKVNGQWSGYYQCSACGEIFRPNPEKPFEMADTFGPHIAIRHPEALKRAERIRITID
jgi:hypothetical protein